MTVALRWLGEGGFTLRVGRRMLALDPCLSRLSSSGPGQAGPDELRLGLALPWCDCILVSHSSMERLADVRCVAQRTGAPVAGSGAACRLLELLGLPRRQVRVVRPGSRLSTAGFDVEVVTGACPDGTLGFRVSAGLITMLTCGAGAGTGGVRADILIASQRQRRSTLARMLRQVRPRLVVACGADTIWRPALPSARPDAGERRVAGAIRAAGIAARLFVPEILRENDLRCLL